MFKLQSFTLLRCLSFAQFFKLCVQPDLEFLDTSVPKGGWPETKFSGFSRHHYSRYKWRFRFLVKFRSFWYKSIQIGPLLREKMLFFSLLRGKIHFFCTILSFLVRFWCFLDQNDQIFTRNPEIWNTMQWDSWSCWKQFRKRKPNSWKFKAI